MGQDMGQMTLAGRPLKQMAMVLSGVVLGMAAGLCAQQASAATWSDTSISWRYGEKFAEPFGVNDIHKNIFALTHTSGYKYGTNFFNVDMLVSDNKDPSTLGGSSGAQEVYIVYRNTVDFGSVTGNPIKFGPIRGVGLTFGFDYNTKNDYGYASKKRMPLIGPTLMFDVPGFLNVSVLILKESNAPESYNFATNVRTNVPRYTYKTHPMLTAAWGIPLGDTGLSFEGFFNYIASKGKNEFGGSTAPETNFDGQIMYDLGTTGAVPKGTFKVGFEYQYWKNKFGNPTTSKIGPGAGPGATAKTPMIRAEYHF